MTGTQQAHGVLATGSRSFALAGKLLPAGCRDDAAVVYAYCRRADDLIDEAPAGTAPARVSELRRELDALVAGARQADPVLAAFQEVLRRRAMPRWYVDELLSGFEMDARPVPLVVASFGELWLYCYRVAGTVGLMMARVLGVTDARVLGDAAALGMGMQLTNIARDVAEDWQRGRLYIPRELFPPDRPAPHPDRPLEPDQAAALSAAVPALLARALPLYRRGDQGVQALPLRAAVAIRAARLIYADIGRRVAAQGHDVTAGRAVVGTPRKLWLALRALVGVPVTRLRVGQEVRHVRVAG